MTKTSRLLSKLLLAALLAMGVTGVIVPQPAWALKGNGVTVCIDPGHQEQADSAMEPAAPGSKVLKPKVTAGAAGTVTGTPEYELNLAVSLLLRERLEERGYSVVMTRENHRVRLSNKERAEIANRAEADLFVRVHADSSASASVRGVTLLHPSADAVDGRLYSASLRAAELVLDSVIARTGAVNRGLSPRSDLAGFNWAQVPSLLIEMGFLSHPEEDRLMATEEYRALLAEGLFEGIDRYFAELEGAPASEPWEGHLLLLREAPLYVRQGYVFRPAGLTLTPQLVRASERSGGWYLVETWQGAMWVNGKGWPDNPSIPSETESVYRLAETTVLYSEPEEGGRGPIGWLEPQPVRVRYEWKGWRCIETWLGDAWIPPGTG